MPPYYERDLLKQADTEDLTNLGTAMAARVRQAQMEAEATPPPPEAQPVDFGALTRSLTASWRDPEQATATSPAPQTQQQPTNGGAFDLNGLINSLTAPWRTQEPSVPAAPSAPGRTSGGAARASAVPSMVGVGATPSAPSAPAAMPSGGDWETKAYRAAVQAGHPNPREFVEQIREESGGDPAAHNAVSGAHGIAQIVPQYHPGVDPNDPDASLAYAARLMADNYRKYGDSATALAAYNAGPGAVQQAGGVPDYAETKGYIASIQGRSSRNAGVPSPPAPAPVAAPSAASSQQAPNPAGAPTSYAPGSYTPNQINAATGEGLDYETALAVCGPAAAIAFARRNGRNPTMQEAVGLAREVGWTAAQGMAGPASQRQLLERLGVASRLVDGAPDWQSVAADVQRGNPVILSTPGHYFVAERFNPEDGTFDFGESANVLKAARGRRWFHPSELPSLGMGDPRATLYMDSPQSPQPSVMAGRVSDVPASVQRARAREQANGGPMLAQTQGAVSDVGISPQQYSDVGAENGGDYGPLAPGPGYGEYGASGPVQPSIVAPYQDEQQVSIPGPGAGPQPAPFIGPEPVPLSQSDYEDQARSASQQAQAADPLAAPPGDPYGAGQAASMVPLPSRFSRPAQSQDVVEDQARQASIDSSLPWAQRAGRVINDVPGQIAAIAPPVWGRGGMVEQMARLEEIERRAAEEVGLDPNGLTRFRATQDPGWRAQHPDLAAEYDDLQQQIGLNVMGQAGDAARFSRAARLPTVEVLRERLGRVEGLIERARATGDTATERDALGVLRQLQSDLVDAHTARLDLEPRIASDVGRRVEDLPPTESMSERTADALHPREAVRAAPSELSGPMSVLPDSGGRQNSVLPFDPASAAAGAAAGGETDENGDPVYDPMRAAGGMAVAGLLGSRQLRQAGQRWQVAQAKAAAQAVAARAAGKAPPATAGDWLRSIGYSGMIGPSTGIVNTFGNGLELAYAIPKEIARGIARGAPREAWEEGKGLLTGVMRSGGEILDALAGAHPGGGVETARLSQRVSNPLASAIAQAIETPTRLFSEVPDAFFRSVSEAIGERRMAAQIATREGHTGAAWSQRVGDLLNDVTNHRAGGAATPEVVQIIKDGYDLSQRLTLRGEVGPRGKAFKAGIDALPFGLGNLVMPFFNTPYQMLQRQLERSPVGIAMKTQPARFDKYYDAMVGTGIAAGVGYVALGGGITGSGPDDPQKRAMLRSQGWQANSTLIRGQWVPNNTFGVFGPMLDTAGELGDAVRYQKKGATNRDIGGDLAKRGLAVVQNQVYLRGIGDLIEAMKDPATFGESYLASTASRMIPLGATARLAGTMTDPNERAVERGDDVGSIETIRQRVARGLPGQGLPVIGGREGLPVAQDVLGRPQENERRGIASLGPRSRTSRPDPVIQAFTDVGIDIGYPPSTFTVDGVKIDMTPEQQRAYQRYMGEAIEKGFNRANGASDRRRTEALQTLYDEARVAAGAKVQAEIGRSEIRSRVRAGAGR